MESHYKAEEREAYIRLGHIEPYHKTSPNNKAYTTYIQGCQ